MINFEIMKSEKAYLMLSFTTKNHYHDTLMIMRWRYLMMIVCEIGPNDNFIACAISSSSVMCANVGIPIDKNSFLWTLNVDECPNNKRLFWHLFCSFQFQRTRLGTLVLQKCQFEGDMICGIQFYDSVLG